MNLLIDARPGRPKGVISRSRLFWFGTLETVR